MTCGKRPRLGLLQGSQLVSGLICTTQSVAAEADSRLVAVMQCCARLQWLQAAARVPALQPLPTHPRHGMMLCMSVQPPEEVCAAAGWIAAIASSPSCPPQLHVAQTSQGLGQLSWRQLPLQGSTPYDKAVQEALQNICHTVLQVCLLHCALPQYCVGVATSWL